MPWVLLTNGVAWNLYHLTFGDGIESVLAFEADISDGIEDATGDLLALLHRQNVKKGELEEFWGRRVALGPASIGRALFTEEALRFIRREIRRREGILIAEEDLGRALHGMLTVEAREQIGPLKIRRKRKAKKDGSVDAAMVPALPDPPAARGDGSKGA